MKSIFSVILNTKTLVIFSVTCNAVLLSHLLLSDLRTANEDFLIKHNELLSDSQNEPTQVHLQTLDIINATIEKNQKFNQELKTFIVNSEKTLIVNK